MKKSGSTRHKTLLLAKRKIQPEHRRFMGDISKLLPQASKANKFDGNNLYLLNELADNNNCDTIAFFESNKNDLLLWISRTPAGPTVCFKVENSRMMDEISQFANYMKASRPLLFFDPQMDNDPVFGIAKELLTRVFSVKNKTKPYVDHAISFFATDGHIWMRHYSVNWDGEGAHMLEEVGPRMALKPMVVLGGSFSGKKLWSM